MYWSSGKDGKIRVFPTQLPFGPTNWNAWRSRDSSSVAWNVMARVSYDVSQNLKVDVGNRYMNAGKYMGLGGMGARLRGSGQQGHHRPGALHRRSHIAQLSRTGAINSGRRLAAAPLFICRLG